MLLQKHFVDQRTLAGTGHARHHGQHPRGNIHADILQVVHLGVPDGEFAFGLRENCPLIGTDCFMMLARQRIGLEQAGIAAFIDNLAAAAPGMRAHIDDMIGHFDHIRVMLDHDDGVALVAQFLQQFIHAVHVARVQADARFVKDIHHIHQTAAEVFDDLDALRFAAGERVGLAVEAEIFQADIDQMLQTFDAAC